MLASDKVGTITRTEGLEIRGFCLVRQAIDGT
jgi:hypothetical protein